LEYFFTPGPLLPPGLGWPLWGKAHLGWLAGLLGLAGLLCFVYRRLEAGGRRRMRRGLALLPAAGELVVKLWLAAQGCFTPWDLPFHLCGLALFLCLWQGFTGSRRAGAVLWCLCLPGAVGALLFPEWHWMPLWQLQTLHHFLYHGLVVSFILMQGLAGEIRPRLRDLRFPLLFLAGAVPLAFLCNRLLGTNFFFLALPSPGSPLEALAVWGRGSYWLLYALLALLVMTAMALPFEAAARRERQEGL